MQLKKDISNLQIKQLISYSNSDSEIAKYTNDQERFKNLFAFKKWRAKGKFIYILESKRKDLQAIVWFSKERAPIKNRATKLCGFTFSIRLYPKIRGKGFAIKIMKKSFDIFYKTKIYNASRNKSFWLTAHQDNLPALKTYKKFGFKNVITEKGKVLMVYVAKKHSKQQLPICSGRGEEGSLPTYRS